MINLLTMLAWRRLFKEAQASQKVLWVTMDTTEEIQQFFMVPSHVGWFLVTFMVMAEFDENEVVAVSTAPIWSFSFVNHMSTGRVRQKLENTYNDDREPTALEGSEEDKDEIELETDEDDEGTARK